MSVLTPTLDRTGMRSLSASVDVDSPPEDVFSLVCSVEKWPVWLSFLRSARRTAANEPIGLGSEVVLRSEIPGDAEELYEVDQFITNHCLSLVGAYSVRRRVEFKVEQKNSRSRLHVRLCYPSYHGKVAAFIDGLRHGRKLLAELHVAVNNFKGLVEYRRNDAALADL
ncbi:MAG TPA: SRPBCC family protein [Candidatus Tyrphobacter sp.]